MKAGLLPDYLQSLFSRGVAAGQSDGRLLGRFAEGRDAGALEALVARHGPMVLRVCRGILDDPHDVEDAFQATFLVLARRAASVRSRDSVAGWLYGVANRVSARARVDAARRRKHERLAADCRTASPPAEASAALLIEELNKLPERYREAIILCHLEGQTCDVAAEHLRRPVGTIKSHLARGRKLLREKLVRRGVSLSLGAAGVSIEAQAAMIPPALARATAAAACRGVVGTTASTLADGILKSMLLTRIGQAMLWTTCLAVATLALAQGLPSEGKPAPEPQEATAKPTTAKPDIPAPKADTHPISLSGHTLDADGKPIPGAHVYLGSLRARYERVAETISDAEGRYEFRDVPLPIQRQGLKTSRDEGAYQVFGEAAGYGYAWLPQVWVVPPPKPADVADKPKPRKSLVLHEVGEEIGADELIAAGVVIAKKR